MYKKKGVSLKLDDVLIRAGLAKPKKKQTIAHKPIVYSTADIEAAKKVLTRLLNAPSRNEVTSTRVIPDEINEV